MKIFNIAGVCIPELHYMADTSDKINQIADMVIRGNYFTIHRARQYGKTTTLALLEEKLKNEYYVINISFEGVGDLFFSSEEKFVKGFAKLVGNMMSYTASIRELKDSWMTEMEELRGIDDLSVHIADFCSKCEKKVVLIIDEVDKSSDNQLFLDFLGMLRNKYTQRTKIPTFYSVILAGVYDVKNLKLKLRPNEERKYNSPWNIAADFEVNMALSAEEIQSMLEEYEKDHQTGMDAVEIAEEIEYYTSGYPFLVSYICFHIDKSDKTKKESLWNLEGVRFAVRDILKGSNSLFESITQNIENYPKFAELIKNILVNGDKIGFNALEPTMKLGLILGIFKEKDGKLVISNLIFEEFIYNYLIAKENTSGNTLRGSTERFVLDGKLDMVKVMNKFQDIMKQEYRKGDEKFLEKQGRLLFLCFIKPIINGTGHYIVEPETRDNARMDIVIFYGKEEHIIELKVWHGQKYHAEGIKQLAGYLEVSGQKKGYMVSFCFNENKEKVIEEYTRKMLSVDGKEIYEVVV